MEAGAEVVGLSGIVDVRVAGDVFAELVIRGVWVGERRSVWGFRGVCLGVVHSSLRICDEWRIMER